MKYFLDTKFLEGTQQYALSSKPTIDLISIGIVCEDGREYYAISKDFNLKEAWNRYDIKQEWYSIDESNQSTRDVKDYWIRDNVLKPIEMDLFKLHCKANVGHKGIEGKGDYKAFKFMLEKYGKTNKQIAEEIIEFCKPIEGESSMFSKSGYESVNIGRANDYVNPTLGLDHIGKRTPPEFYGYYSDYDWVVFCWLFGKMIDLPNGFPKYCIDLKQVLDETVLKIKSENDGKLCFTYSPYAVEYKNIEEHHDYPKQTNEHHALADARWCKELYHFLNNL